MVSPGGIEAWLVQDTKIPLLSIKFFFKGGVETDPAGKEGLANLTSTLLDEGAGPYDSEEFQRRLADNSISIGFTATTDGFYGGVHTLVETQDEAVDLARLALTQPRFDDEAVERMRRGVLTQIRRDQGDPDFLARRALYEMAFPDHPYGRRARGSVESVGSITRDDMTASSGSASPRTTSLWPSPATSRRNSSVPCSTASSARCPTRPPSSRRPTPFPRERGKRCWCGVRSRRPSS